MLAITPNFTQNNNQRSNVSFKSKFGETEYLKKGLNYAIENCKGVEVDASAVKFCKSLKALINDGKKDIITIDAEPGSVIGFAHAKHQNIFVNGELVKHTDGHGGLIYDENQCMAGVKRYATVDKELNVDNVKLSPLEETIENLQKQLIEAKKNFNKEVRAQLLAIRANLIEK